MVPLIVASSLLVLALLAVVLVLRARRTQEPVLGAGEPPMMRLEPGELAVLEDTAVSLDSVLAQAGVTLYIPTGSEDRFLAVSQPGTEAEGRSSTLPSQLAAAAVAGQSGIEAMVRAGQLTGRLVMVDPKTAQAIRASTMVTDKAGQMLGIIRDGRGFAGLTRIKPLSGGLVKSAAAGPAMMSAIAMQAQLAEVEKAISEVRDAVNAVRGYLEAAERAAVEGRRQTLATVYRTARDANEMTQPLWDQIQGLEADLRRDVSFADQHLAEQVRQLEGGTTGLVGTRLKWLAASSAPVAAAVAGVADARRALVQFSTLRLWWLTVIEDPTLASRHEQLRELLDTLPTHDGERALVAEALRSVGQVGVHHRVLAPRKYKVLGREVDDAVEELQQLPWAIVDVRTAGELVP